MPGGRTDQEEKCLLKKKARTHLNVLVAFCQDHTLQCRSRSWSCERQLYCRYSHRRTFLITDFTCVPLLSAQSRAHLMSLDDCVSENNVN